MNNNRCGIGPGCKKTFEKESNTIIKHLLHSSEGGGGTPLVRSIISPLLVVVVSSSSIRLLRIFFQLNLRSFVRWFVPWFYFCLLLRFDQTVIQRSSRYSLVFWVIRKERKEKGGQSLYMAWLSTTSTALEQRKEFNYKSFAHRLLAYVI